MSPKEHLQERQGLVHLLLIYCRQKKTFIALNSLESYSLRKNTFVPTSNGSQVTVAVKFAQSSGQNAGFKNVRFDFVVMFLCNIFSVTAFSNFRITYKPNMKAN